MRINVNILSAYYYGLIQLLVYSQGTDWFCTISMLQKEPGVNQTVSLCQISESTVMNIFVKDGWRFISNRLSA